jgi:hypothetical protein
MFNLNTALYKVLKKISDHQKDEFSVKLLAQLHANISTQDIHRLCETNHR